MYRILLFFQFIKLLYVYRFVFRTKKNDFFRSFFILKGNEKVIFVFLVFCILFLFYFLKNPLLAGVISDVLVLSFVILCLIFYKKRMQKVDREFFLLLQKIVVYQKAGYSIPSSLKKMNSQKNSLYVEFLMQNVVFSQQNLSKFEVSSTLATIKRAFSLGQMSLDYLEFYIDQEKLKQQLRRRSGQIKSILYFQAGLMTSIYFFLLFLSLFVLQLSNFSIIFMSFGLFLIGVLLLIYVTGKVKWKH